MASKINCINEHEAPIDKTKVYIMEETGVASFI